MHASHAASPAANASRKTRESAPTLPINGTLRAPTPPAHRQVVMLAPPPRIHTSWLIAVLAGAALAFAGCAAFPDRRVEPQFHNPFPQLHRVAVLPFYNQSAEPTVDGDAIALAYYNELQVIPGFEVMPVGVAKQLLIASGIEPRTGSDFQKLARAMNVDAVLVGSVTEYSPYYPPRIGLAVDWYAANPGFHPIPAGLWPAVGPRGGRVHSQHAGPAGRVRTGPRAAQNADARRCPPISRTMAASQGGMSHSDRAAESIARCGTSDSTRMLALPALATTVPAVAARLARSARLHAAAAQSHPSHAAPAARADHHAHADLSRPGRTVYRAAGKLLLLSRRRPLRRLARLSCSVPTISSASAATCT